MSQFPFPSHLFSCFNVSVFYVWELFFIHFSKFVGNYLSIEVEYSKPNYNVCRVLFYIYICHLSLLQEKQIGFLYLNKTKSIFALLVNRPWRLK